MAYLLISEEATKQGILVDESKALATIGKGAAVGASVGGAFGGVGAPVGATIGAIGGFLGEIFGFINKKVSQENLLRALLFDVFTAALGAGKVTIDTSIPDADTPKLIGSYDKIGIINATGETIRALRDEYSVGSDDFDDVNSALTSLEYTTVRPSNLDRVILVFNTAENAVSSPIISNPENGSNNNLPVGVGITTTNGGGSSIIPLSTGPLIVAGFAIVLVLIISKR